MFSLFKRHQAGYKRAGKVLYRQAVEQARRPEFYNRYDVPDCVDGRFELICLHVFLIMDRLLQEGREGSKLSQALFDSMFHDMEWSLREQGVGDLGVPKHMKRMMTGFNGRSQTYAQALNHSSDNCLDFQNALRRNLFGTSGNVDGSVLRAMTQYVLCCKDELMAQSLQDLKGGKVRFPGINQRNEARYDEKEKRTAAC